MAGKTGMLQSMGPQIVRYDGNDLAHTHSVLGGMDCKEIQPVHPKGD